METMKEFQMIDKRTAAGVYPAEEIDGNNLQPSLEQLHYL
jgi:hypothetical protein